jgi:hypothetical protein
MLVVPNIEAAQVELVERSVEASPVQHYEGAEFVDGRGEGWNSFVFFSDPEGNGWTLQQRPLAISEAQLGDEVEAVFWL